MIAEPASDPVAVAASLMPFLRSQIAETDTLARLPDATVATLEERHLFDMLVPRIYCGRQIPLTTYMDVIVELGKGDGSVAWNVALLAIGTWMATTFYPKEVVDEVFAAGGNFRTAAVLNPRSAKVRSADGGVVIEEGLWAFNSGVEHAGWDVLGIPFHDDAGNVVDRGAALIPASQVKLVDDWDTIGLRGSGSTTVRVADVFVPTERIALLSKARRENYASAYLTGEPLYRFPFVPFFAINLGLPGLGMAKAALDLFLEKSRGRGIAFTKYPKQDQAAVTHLLIGEVSSKIDAAELILKRSLEELETTALLGKMTMERRTRIWRDAGFASQLVWQAVDLLASASGGSFARTSDPMNRIWRDARVATLHGALNTDTTDELFGRVATGHAPNNHLLGE
ncbi:acyl-CoA dehydrogenase [Candidatus Phyllobacterium onerii]|uniref:acyl-CoA dehydrogenase n=1 Tax=Candidatus Phyllobacterium onerii TaxID=3020828 RepID=UPI00233132B7|nr:acyl-CoA dehydrogenase [Phyllobacterium sp. IY22]